MLPVYGQHNNTKTFVYSIFSANGWHIIVTWLSRDNHLNLAWDSNLAAVVSFKKTWLLTPLSSSFSTFQTYYFALTVWRMRTSHRKSRSTSALSLLAHSSALAPPTSLKQNTSRQHLDRFKQGQSVLPSDNEQSSNPGFGISSRLQGVVDDRLRDNYPGDALKKGRSEGDARELLDDVSNFFYLVVPVLLCSWACSWNL